MVEQTRARRRRGRPPGPPVDPTQRREALTSALGLSAGGIADPAEQTRAAIDILAGWFEDEPQLAQALSGHLLPTAPLSDTAVVAAITGILSEGFAARGRDTAPAPTWAHALVGAMSSTITWWSATRTISREQVVDHLFLLVWSGFSGIDTPR